MKPPVARPRIYLSPPHMSGLELQYVHEAFESNWIAPLGPNVDAFELEFSRCIGGVSSAALSSGTAALHLALIILGIRPGDEVLCSSLTFSASANAIVYLGASPVFIDSEASSWNLSPGLVAEELKACAQRGRLPKALVAVDLYGQCADYDPIRKICSEYGVPIVEDAAEALGASYKGKPAGSFGKMAVFSFNGNKIITTSGGGMLVSQDEELIRKARFLATQARDEALHYQHSTIGYNYRMSNVLAGIGRGQLSVLQERVEKRRWIFEYYRKAMKDLPGVNFMLEAPNGKCTRWLTCLTIEPSEFGATKEDVRLALEKGDIESKLVWKPMHLQPVFSSSRFRGGAISEAIFEKGLCLPSGSSLQENDLERIVTIIRSTCKKPL